MNKIFGAKGNGKVLAGPDRGTISRYFKNQAANNQGANKKRAADEITSGNIAGGKVQDFENKSKLKPY